MKKAFFVITISFFTVVFLARIAVIRADETPVKLVPVLIVVRTLSSGRALTVGFNLNNS
jgi:hypothetical protein